MKRLLLYIVVFLIFSLLALLALSPISYKENPARYLIKDSIEIDAPVDVVYRYLGDSDHAQDWSVFVDHITPLNENAYADGNELSKRRCFKNSDETGMQWDEEIIETANDQYRLLSIYNLVSFPVKVEGLRTEQLYSEIAGDRTMLSLTLYKENKNVSAMDWLKLKLFSHYISSTFRSNLEGIKREVEGI